MSIWGVKDSDLRRHSQQIYSLSPLTTRETPQIKAASRIRTHDPEITNHVLYQLSYSGICFVRAERLVYYTLSKKMSTPTTLFFHIFSFFLHTPFLTRPFNTKGYIDTVSFMRLHSPLQYLTATYQMLFIGYIVKSTLSLANTPVLCSLGKICHAPHAV